MIKHHPLFDREKVTKLYSEKDGVPVSYVCTSALGSEDAYARDIYFRATPHPDFGNRYFALFYDMRPRLTKEQQLLICSADIIEERTFSMIKGTNGWEYSQHRHDFREVPGSGLAIDGGRSYCRLVGDIHGQEPREFVVRDGKMVKA